jgi:glycosyltransferase involved in cell wall biosynthesis
MASRKKIGLVYGYTENWIAGAYYVINVIRALNYLDDKIKPHITILHYNSNGLDLIKNLNYPYINYYLCKPFNNEFLERVINKVCRTFLNKNMMYDKKLSKEIDYVFPVEDGFESVKHKVAWIPDFQDYYYPENFEKKYIYYRQLHHKQIVQKGYNIIFSSHNANNDFIKFYPQSTNKLFVVNFASILNNDYSKLDSNALIQKYALKERYFISPNQFWKHKNHITVLKAAKILSEHNFDFQIVFTGKEVDQRNPEHFKELKQYVTEHRLENVIKFLGFIDRNEQLQLMNHSIAVIQPSLFEGWSTVVEDCKSIGKYVILSDIDVHKEQLDQNVRFFKKDDPQDLANAIKQIAENGCVVQRTDYNKNIQKFGKDFINAFE